METVYNFNLSTPEEIELFGVSVTEEFRQSYIHSSSDTLNIDLFRLHILRNQPEAAEKYLGRIKDDSSKLAMNLLLSEIED